MKRTSFQSLLIVVATLSLLTSCKKDLTVSQDIVKAQPSLTSKGTGTVTSLGPLDTTSTKIKATIIWPDSANTTKAY